MFFKKESPVSLTELFKKKSQHWQKCREQKSEGRNLPLRAFLFHTLLSELLKRLEAVSKSPDQLALADKLQFFLPRASHSLLGLQSELQAAGMPRRSADRSLQHDRADQEMQTACIPRLRLLRFHSTQKLNNPMQGPTLPFLLQVGSATQEATTLYQHLPLLTHFATWQLVGSSLHLERMGRLMLANEMASKPTSVTPHALI